MKTVEQRIIRGLPPPRRKLASERALKEDVFWDGPAKSVHAKHKKSMVEPNRAFELVCDNGL
jgi:hypothetical protein